MSILDLARRAGDIPQSEMKAGILLYGPSGSGKTHAAVAGGKPFVLLFEDNGLATIRRANPNAVVLLVKDQGRPGQKDYKPALDLVRDVMMAAMSGQLRDAGFDRLVLDSATELQRLLKGDIRGKMIDKEEKDPVARELAGLLFSQQQWGFLAEKGRNFFRLLRSLPIPVVVTALVEEGHDGERVQPSFEGRKTANEVAQFFNCVGFTLRRMVAGEDGVERPVYRVMFDGPARYLTKSFGDDICGVMEPDVYGWMQLISGRIGEEEQHGGEE